MRSLIWVTLAGLVAIPGLPGFAREDEPETDAYPRLVVLEFRTKDNADCKSIESRFLTRLRTDYAEKDVLFVTVDLSTAASRHQGKLLLCALDLGQVYRAHVKTPGCVVLADPSTAEEAGKLTVKDDATTARAAIERLLRSEEEEGDEPPGDDEEGDDN